MDWKSKVLNLTSQSIVGTSVPHLNTEIGGLALSDPLIETCHMKNLDQSSSKQN